MTTTTRSLRAALMTPVLALALAACGSGAGDSAQDPSSSAPASSSDGASAPSGDATDEFVARYTAGVEKMMTTAAFTMDIDAAGQTMAATGVMDNAAQPPSVSMQMEMPGAGTARVLIVDGEQFVSADAIGEGWMRVDPAEMAGLGVPATTDPLEQLRVFQEAIVGVEERGQEDVDGVPATRYVVTVDTAAIDNPAGAPLPPEVTYDIWLDDEDRTVRMVNELEAQGMQVSTTLTFTSFGDPVDITAPPAEEISEMPAVTAQG